MTAGDVLQLSREMLADTRVSLSGSAFTDAKLLPFLKPAFRELNAVAIHYGLPSCLRALYRFLRAYDSEIDLTTSPEFAFVEPYEIREALPLSTHSVESAAVEANSGDGQATARLKLTVPAADQDTSFHQGATAVLMGVTGAPLLNGEWSVIAVSPVSQIFVIVNCDVDPTSAVWTYSKLSHVQGRFYRIYRRDEEYEGILQPAQVASRLEYEWHDDRLVIPPGFRDRIYRMRIFANLPEPTQAADVIPFTGAENFLAARTASLAIDPIAGGSQDAQPALAQRLAIAAMGPGMQVDGSGGHLADWLGMQRVRLRTPPTTTPVSRRG